MGQFFERLCEVAAGRLGTGVIRHARNPGEQAGYFRVDISKRDGRPIVSLIVRAESGHAGQFNDEGDVCVLAHELGHHDRWKSGAESPDYRAIVDVPTEQWKAFPRPLRETIVAEEQAAWDFAHELLTNEGFAARDVFDAQRAASLGTYESALLAAP